MIWVLTSFTTRYKDDVYDRIWRGYTPDGWVIVNNTESLQIQSTDDPYKVPSEVLRTAVQPLDNVNLLNYSEQFQGLLTYFNVYLHFVEVQRIPEGRKREFTITVNGNQSEPITPQYLKPLTLDYQIRQSVNGFVSFVIKFESTQQSDLPPILNGFEILFGGPTNAPTSATDGMLHVIQLHQSYSNHVILTSFFFNICDQLFSHEQSMQSWPSSKYTI